MARESPLLVWTWRVRCVREGKRRIVGEGRVQACMSFL